MYLSTKNALILTLIYLLHSFSINAHDGKLGEKIKREKISSDIIPVIEINEVKSLIIELAPSSRAGVHSHAGLIYAYVLEGSVRSQLNHGEIIEYDTGQAWVEPAFIEHTLTENVSDTEIAKLLVVFVAKKGANMTTSGL